MKFKFNEIAIHGCVYKQALFTSQGLPQAIFVIFIQDDS